MLEAIAQLDPRERRFVEIYVETSNATRSALAAGYGRNYNSAASIAPRLLKKIRIKEAVDQLHAQHMAELDFTPDRIVREIAKVAGVNAADFITMETQDDGTEKPVIDFSRTTRRHLAAVSSVENTDKGVKYKTHDKLKALDMLARMAKLYPAERRELTGADGGPITTANLNATVHKIDIEALDIDQREQLRSLIATLEQSDEPVDSGP
jgi:phage terminase small subunit